VNARYGAEAVIGSTTETSDNTFDLFIAVRAPATGAALAGPYTTASLEFPGGSTANMRASQFSLASSSTTALQPISVTGHAANLGGRVQTQQVSAATYSLNADGSGTLNLGAASSSQLLSGTRILYVSASGNIVIGGSTAAGSHDLFVGVKAVSGATAATWNTTFWGAGLRVDATGVAGYAGSVAARGTGKLTWTKRLKALGAGKFDFTGINAYAVSADGTGTVELTRVGLGRGGQSLRGRRYQ
jgi:hypothetical protein